MLEVSKIKLQKEDFVNRLKKRGFEAETIFDEIILLDDERKLAQQEGDAILQKGNEISKSVGDLYKQGKREEADALKVESAKLKEEVAVIKEKMKRIESDIKEKLYTIPNVPHDSVPAGKDEKDNDTIFEHGEIPKLHDQAMPHWELATFLR